MEYYRVRNFKQLVEKNKPELNSLKFSLKNGFLLYLPYEKNFIAKNNRFTFVKNKKAWQTLNYRNAYRVISCNEDIKCSKNIREFFVFYGEDIWKSIKKIRRALVKIKEKCDYAQKRDGTGFSQSDKKIGRQLVLKPKWNNFEILQAAWIVFVHKKQVKDIIEK